MKESTTSGWVQKFAEHMEQKLSENRHKGDRPGWLKVQPEFLINRVEEELLEVKEAIASGKPALEVWREAADVANMIGMAADSYEHHKSSGFSTNAELSRRELTRLVCLEAIWNHDTWRFAAVEFMKYHADVVNAPLRVLVDSSDPGQFGGPETYSDRLWSNAARMALHLDKG